VLAAYAPIILIGGTKDHFTNTCYTHVRVYQTCAGLVLLFPPNYPADRHREVRCGIDHTKFVTAGYRFSTSDDAAKYTNDRLKITYAAHRLE
jgi:hypothetical protein